MGWVYGVISNIKITKDEVFDNFIFEFNVLFFF